MPVKSAGSAVTIWVRSSGATATNDARLWTSFLTKELPDFRCGDAIMIDGRSKRITDRTWDIGDDVTLVLDVSPPL